MAFLDTLKGIGSSVGSFLGDLGQTFKQSIQDTSSQIGSVISGTRESSLGDPGLLGSIGARNVTQGPQSSTPELRNEPFKTPSIGPMTTAPNMSLAFPIQGKTVGRIEGDQLFLEGSNRPVQFLTNQGIVDFGRVRPASQPTFNQSPAFDPFTGAPNFKADSSGSPNFTQGGGSQQPPPPGFPTGPSIIGKDDQGNPIYFDRNTGLPSNVDPRTGKVKAQTSTSFSPLQFGGTANTTTSGVSPGGRSAFTGLLTGTSGLGSSGLPGDQEDTEEGRQFLRQELDALNKRLTEENLPIPPVEAETNVGELIDQAQGGASITQAAENINIADFQQTLNKIQSEALRIKAVLDAKVPPEPVVETDAQDEFIQQFPPNERTDIRAAMDDMRRQLGLPELESQRIDILNGIQSANEAFTGILDDINNNPDLPKGLAKRRIEQVLDTQKQAISRLTSQLEIVGYQIDQGNQRLDREFQILQFEADEEERRRDNARQTLDILIGSGAFGAMTDKELAAQARAAGVPFSALKSIRTQAQQPDVEIRGSVRDGLIKITKRPGGGVEVEQLTGPTQSTSQADLLGFGGNVPTKEEFRKQAEEYIRNSKITGPIAPGDTETGTGFLAQELDALNRRLTGQPEGLTDAEVDTLYNEYLQEVGLGFVPTAQQAEEIFTPTQLQAIAQAGLQNASVADQLKFLNSNSSGVGGTGVNGDVINQAIANALSSTE